MWLHDCVCNDPSEAELLLLGSAAALQAATIDRDRYTQALLEVAPSFTCGEGLIDTLASAQCQSVIAVLGVGVSVPDDALVSVGPGEVLFDIEKRRYGRVLVVTEQNEVGRRVRHEVLRFLFTYMRPLLSAGLVFVPETPLEPGFTQKEFVERVLCPATRRLGVIVAGDSWEATLSRLE